MASPARTLRRNRRRQLVAQTSVALFALAASVVDDAEPASANHGYQRERSATTKWAPTSGVADARFVDPLANTLRWDLLWVGNRSIPELNGRHRALQLKANTVSGYADSYDGWIADNFPAGSNVTTDTQALENPGANAREFGAVIGNASLIARSTGYFVEVGVYKPVSGPNPLPIEWQIHASTERGDDTPNGCFPNVSWCVFPDWIHVLIRGCEFQARNDQTKTVNWKMQRALNPGFEDGNMQYWSQYSGTSATVTCNPLQTYDGSCYASFKHPNSAAGGIYQDLALNSTVNDHWTVEAAVRCPTSTAGCPIRLQYQGLLNGTETRSVDATVPANNQWYMCRLDINHGASADFDRDHANVRMSVIPRQVNRLIEVDFTTLTTAATVTSGGFGDAGIPGPGATCTRANLYE